MLYSLNGIDSANFFEFREAVNHTFPLHCHYTVEVIFVLSGRITVTKEKTSHILTRGEAVAIMPFEKHGIATAAREHSQVFWFQVSPKLISNWDLCFAGKTFQQFSRSFSEEKLEHIYDLLKSTTGNLIDVNCIFFETMHEFLQTNALVPCPVPNDICLQALQYIGRNFTKRITLKEMAKELNVSYVYLSRVFAKKINFKFVDCINSFRLQEAMALLADPQKSIAEICYACGFGSLRQFNRLFLQTLACTPKEYRRKVLQNP